MATPRDPAHGLIVDQGCRITDEDRARFRAALQPGQPLRVLYEKYINAPAHDGTSAYRRCKGCGHDEHAGKPCGQRIAVLGQTCSCSGETIK